MTDKQVNKRIHEIIGLCHHNNIGQRDVSMCNDEGKVCGGYLGYYCVDCDEHIMGLSSPIVVRYNFTGAWKTSAYEFGIMWEFMHEHERWEEFRDRCGIIRDVGSWYIYEGIISPRPFAEAMVRFFEEGKP